MVSLSFVHNGGSAVALGGVCHGGKDMESEMGVNLHGWGVGAFSFLVPLFFFTLSLSDGPRRAAFGRRKFTAGMMMIVGLSGVGRLQVR